LTRRWSVAGLLLGLSCLAGAAAVPGSASVAAARPVGNIKVFAHVPSPGEPSLTLVTPHRKVFVGTFEDVTGSDTSPSKVFKYDAHGKLLKTYVVRGQTPGAAHGVQVAARDHDGRLYLLDQQPARVVVLNPRTGHQQTWATFADVPTCAAAKRSTNCSNTINDGAPEPDYAAWLPDGSLIVSDYSQQLLWRVPPHGGVARVWLNDKVLDGELFGPAGLVLMPSHRSLLVTVATGGLTSASSSDDPARGRLYRIPLGHHDRPKRLVHLWSSAAGQAPDGFAVSRSRRHVYIAMAGPTASSVVEVNHTDHGWQTGITIPKTQNGIGDSPVLWDTATSVQFLGRRILVTNQAYFTDIKSHWVIFDVRTARHGQPDFVPQQAGPA
jgi:sugar lactone lactonase YvrE